jgi:hypothetical protein
VKRFIARYAERISGVLSGFDRLIFRGTLRRFAYPDGLAKYLGSRGILLKDFAEFAHTATARVKTASELEASRAGRPVVYLESSRQNKERLALDIAERDHVEQGLIAVIQCVEPCVRFDIYRMRVPEILAPLIPEILAPVG